MTASKRRGILLAAIIIILAVGTFLLLRSCGNDTAAIPDEETPLAGGFDLAPSTALADSAPEQPDQEDVLAELNRQVAEGMITMSMNPDPTFENGRAKGSVLIHNNESNRHTQVVQILRDDTGEVIYTSGAIPVGKYINSDALAVGLDAGDYPCTAYFNSVDDAGQILGTGAVHITVHINS